MSDKFKAIVINNQNDKFTRDLKEINKSDLKDEIGRASCRERV